MLEFVLPLLSNAAVSLMIEQIEAYDVSHVREQDRDQERARRDAAVRYFKQVLAQRE